MAWIESHQTLAHHPKTHHLSRLLATTIPATIGHLHMLWYWAVDFAPDGNVGRYAPEVIASACLWKKKPLARFTEALTEAGFLEADGSIHDWDDYTGKSLAQRAANKERMRRARAAHVRDTTGARAELPNLTKPDQHQTEPDLTQPDPPDHLAASESRRARDPLWDALTACYGDPPTTSRFRGAWNAALADIRGQADASPEEIIRRFRAGKASGDDWQVATPAALAKYWGQLGQPQMKGSAGTRELARQLREQGQ